MISKSISYLMIGAFASGLLMTALGVMDVVAGH